MPEEALAVGEKAHIVERRKFEGDLRRQFVAQVEFANAHHLRANGNMFVFSPPTGLFERIEPGQVRVFDNDNQIGITVLPPHFDPQSAEYKRIRNEMQFCDANGFKMELGDFGARG